MCETGSLSSVNNLSTTIGGSTTSLTPSKSEKLQVRNLLLL